MIAENLKLNVQVGTLARIFDQLGYPNPDDDDDWGPWGPVVHRFDDVMLNPQPLPPKFITKATNQAAIQTAATTAARAKRTATAEPHVQEAPATGATSIRSALMARATLDRVIGLAQFAAGAGRQGEEMVRSALNQVIDDWCGTPPKPRPWPLPWPYPLRWSAEEIVVQPIDQIMMGVHLYKTSEFLGKGTLAKDFAGAAEKLTQAGLQRLG